MNAIQRIPLPLLGFVLMLPVFVAALSAGLLYSPPGEPGRGIIIGLFSWLLVFAVAVWTSTRARRFVASGNLAATTGIQGWRVLGGVFLFLWWFEMLPPVFAIPAGIGDVLVGIAAPFVVARLAAGRLQPCTFYVFHTLGLLDFTIAFGTGTYAAVTLSGQGFVSMSSFPMVVIPGLLVPYFAIMHISALMQFANRRPLRRYPDACEPPSARDDAPAGQLPERAMVV